MTAQQLRKSILQMAVQGKLVPQDPSDEPAHILLERIRAEKERLIKEKKIKKEKNPSVIYRGTDNLHYEKFADGTIKCIDDEIPFDIPESWVWAALKHITLSIRDGSHNPPSNKGYGLPMLSAANIDNGFVNLRSATRWLTKAEWEIENQRTNIEFGDVLLTIVGSLGRSAVVETNESFALQRSVAVLKPCIVCSEYLMYALQSPYIQNCFNDNSKGTAQKGVYLNTLSEFRLPIPPFEEQQRIVHKINEIVPMVLQYDRMYVKAETLITKFPQQIKHSILQWAVQGKLVQQDENDEPASVLLERIRAEKEELIKQGKIKRDKRESVIYRGADNSYYERFADGSEKCIDEEIPFEIPKGWEWTRFSTVITLLSGQDLLSNQYNDTENGIPYITGASNIENGNIIVSRWTDSGRVFAYRGDLLLTCKGTIGEMAVLYAPKAHIARQIMAIRSTGTIEIMYIKLVLDSLISTLKEKSKGLIPGITRSDILDSMLPLPSNTEQKRIITCIENLANQLDAMAESLS